MSGKHKNCEACAKHEACPVWDSAAYFDTYADREELGVTNADEAIADHIDQLDDEQRAKLFASGGLEVVAFARIPGPDAAWFKATAIDAVERAEENWSENWGGEGPPLNDEQRKALEKAIAERLRATFSQVFVWRCDEVARRTYSAEQLAPFKSKADESPMAAPHVEAPPTPPCPECSGRTVEFRFSGLDTQQKVCSRWREPGHLTEAEVRERIRIERQTSRPPSGRFA